MKQFKQIIFMVPALFLAGCATDMPDADIAVEEAGATMVYSHAAPAAAPAPVRAWKTMAANGGGVSDRSFAAPEGRKMAFTASIHLYVSDVKKAIADTRKNTMASGGYVKTLNNNMLVLAIPVAKGDAFLNTLAGMGEVTDLVIQGTDVTEQVSDLKIRMENLEKSRKRLLSLMDRTANVKDLTQVERELNRVTTELERLQAADKNLTNRIAYVTITVYFRTVVPVKVTPSANVPLQWINKLGEGMQNWITGNQGEVTVPFRVTLPEKFFFAGKDYAVSGNNCNLRFREIRNAVTDIRWYGKKYAPVEFYKDMIQKALQTRFNGKISCSECVIDGEKALWFQAETNIHGTDYLYLVAVSVDDDTVRVIEAKGKKAALLSELGIDNWKKMLESIR